MFIKNKNDAFYQGCQVHDIQAKFRLEYNPNSNEAGMLYYDLLILPNLYSIWIHYKDKISNVPKNLGQEHAYPCVTSPVISGAACPSSQREHTGWVASRIYINVLMVVIFQGLIQTLGRSYLKIRFRNSFEWSILILLSGNPNLATTMT